MSQYDSTSKISKTDQVLVLLNRLQQRPATSSNADASDSHDASIRAIRRSSDEDAGNGHIWQQWGGNEDGRQRWASFVEGSALEEQDETNAALAAVLGEQRAALPEGRRLRRSTNSFRTKLFGQAFHEEVENSGGAASPSNVRVHPLSMFRMYWDLAIMVVVVYTVLMLPLRAAFYWDYYRDLGHHHSLFDQIRVDGALVLDLLVDVLLMADVLLNFHTGFIREQVLVMERQAVRQNYLRGWFTLDLAAAFPLDLVTHGKRVDMLRLPSLLKIFRLNQSHTLTRMVHELQRTPWMGSVSRFHTQILRMLGLLLLWAHWDACLHYGACSAQAAHSNCWVYAAGLADASIGDKYSWSVLKALSATFTAGYGRSGTEPATTIDCWVTILSMLVGCCLWTVLGGIVTTLLIHLNAASSEYTAKMQELYQYMAHRHLPQELRQRIRESYEARWTAEKHFNEEELLQELPASLRTEVSMHQCKDVIAAVPFFEDAEQGFTTSIVTLLKPTVHLKGDYIVREGELSREMYFIKSGAVQVEICGRPVTVLKKGSYFGEVGLLRGTRRCASVRALSRMVDLFVLTKEGFDSVMAEYPESFKAMDLVAEHRLRALHASEAWRLQPAASAAPLVTDLGVKIEQLFEEEVPGAADDGDGGRDHGLPSCRGHRRHSGAGSSRRPSMLPFGRPLFAPRRPRLSQESDLELQACEEQRESDPLTVYGRSSYEEEHASRQPLLFSGKRPL